MKVPYSYSICSFLFPGWIVFGRVSQFRFVPSPFRAVHTQRDTDTDTHTHTQTHTNIHSHTHTHRDTQNLIEGGIVFTSVDESAALVLCDKKGSDKNARRKSKTKKQVKGAR